MVAGWRRGSAQVLPEACTCMAGTQNSSRHSLCYFVRNKLSVPVMKRRRLGCIKGLKPPNNAFANPYQSRKNVYQRSITAGSDGGHGPVVLGSLYEYSFLCRQPIACLSIIAVDVPRKASDFQVRVGLGIWLDLNIVRPML